MNPQYVDDLKKLAEDARQKHTALAYANAKIRIEGILSLLAESALGSTILSAPLSEVEKTVLVTLGLKTGTNKDGLHTVSFYETAEQSAKRPRPFGDYD